MDSKEAISLRSRLEAIRLEQLEIRRTLRNKNRRRRTARNGRLIALGAQLEKEAKSGDPASSLVFQEVIKQLIERMDNHNRARMEGYLDVFKN